MSRRPRASAWASCALAALALLAAAAAAREQTATDAEVRVTCGVSCHKFPPPDILPRDAWKAEIQLMARLREDRAPKAVATPNADASGLPPLSAPLPKDMQRALAYYRRHAPARLPPPDAWPAIDSLIRSATAANSVQTLADSARSPAETAPPRGLAPRGLAPRGLAPRGLAPHGPAPRGLAFITHEFTPEGAPQTPAVSHVRFADLDDDSRLEALACDMRFGLVFLLRPYAPADPLRLVTQLPAPAHVEVTDLDRDGLNDLLVADLGEFQPGDHRKGAAVWLHGVRNPVAPGTQNLTTRGPRDPIVPGTQNPIAAGTNFHPVILGGLPRVADVEAADLDEDGRQDLIVAAFGWRAVGSLRWLRNESRTDQPDTAPPTQPTFKETVLDPRPGAIHAIPVDLNHDGHLDIVSVIAQEHEEIVALMNDGHGRFDHKSLYAAPHPNWGSSGIQVVDLDNDNDLDVVLAHGDMFDDFLIKPYHGVQWLENRGTFPFTPHALCAMPGVHRAVAADLDDDGDLDVVGAALIPGMAGDRRVRADLPSLVWLEQTSRGQFVRHTLERGRPTHATLDVGDYDRDGDIDLIVGNMVDAASTDARAPGDARARKAAGPGAWVEVWENVTRAPNLINNVP